MIVLVARRHSASHLVIVGVAHDRALAALVVPLIRGGLVLIPVRLALIVGVLLPTAEIVVVAVHLVTRRRAARLHLIVALVVVTILVIEVVLMVRIVAALIIVSIVPVVPVLVLLVLVAVVALIVVPLVLLTRTV